jgi:nicotinate-nucleotide pyrophosphorylase (carboxylating)
MNLMKHQIIEFLKEVLNEDIGRGDLARNLIKGDATAFVKSKSEGIIAGLEYIKYFSEMADVKFDFFYEDGSEYKNGDIIFEVYGNAKDILSIERTMLNILQHASGIASNAYKFNKKANKKIKILDTRKTRPLLRNFEKYAAFCGGITNHRLGLDDCLMLKDTHLALFDSITDAISKARKDIPFTTAIEIETETITQAKEAISNGADIVMCDNMDFETIKEVVEFRNQYNKMILIEASGNVTLENIEKYIETGVDAISSGAIIHQATFLDFSMKTVK